MGGGGNYGSGVGLFIGCLGYPVGGGDSWGCAYPHRWSLVGMVSG